MTVLAERPAPVRPGPADPTPPPVASGRSGTPSSLGGLVVLAEVAIVALSLGAVVGLARLFVDWSYLPKVAGMALVSHGIALVCRRRGLSLSLAGFASLVGLVLAIGWIMFPTTTWYGLPAGRTLSAYQTALSDAYGQFNQVLAPTLPRPGFVLACGIAVWVVAFVADWAALRAWTTIEALVPATTLFLFGAALGGDRYRLAVGGAFVGAVGGHLLVHRSVQAARAGPWVAARAAAGGWSLVRSGALLGAIAIAIGVLVGPQLPGSSSAPILDWRKRAGEGGGVRETVSPLVDIRGRLVNQSNVEMFTVQAGRSSYWRLTSLDSFDGNIWSARGSYRKVGERVPTAGEFPATATALVQDVVIGPLNSIWLPAAYRPARLAGGGTVRYDPVSASLLSDAPTSDGLSYRLESEMPNFSPDELRATSAAVPSDIAERFLELPGGFSQRATAEAQRITGDEPTRYEKAIALQNHFQRNFRYDLNVAPGHSDNRLEQFLFTEKAGYCEQFSGAFAAMARSVGMPARVAVGFTPGEEDTQGTFHVRGTHAHAWPEVYLGEAGWVAFEPTPGRGAPGAQDYTGLPENQSTEGDGALGGTTGLDPGSTTTSVPDGSTTTASTMTVPPSPTPQPTDEGLGTLVRVLGWLGVVAVVTAAWFGTLATLRRRLRAKRRAAAGGVAGTILLAWDEAVEALVKAGHAPRRGETRTEVTTRLGSEIGDAAPALVALGLRADAAAFAPDVVSRDDAAKAADQSAQVEAAVWRAMTPWARLVRLADPRGIRGGGARRVIVHAVAVPEQFDAVERTPVGAGR